MAAATIQAASRQEDDMQTMLRAIAAAALTVSASAAFASQSEVVAQLTDVKGSVLVDTGKGFAPVAGPTALKLGDRVVVNGKGQAMLSYGPACRFPLQSPSVTTIDRAGCVVGTQGGAGGGAGQTDNPRPSGPAANLPLFAFAGSMIVPFTALGAEIVNTSSNDNNTGYTQIK